MTEKCTAAATVVESSRWRRTCGIPLMLVYRFAFAFALALAGCNTVPDFSTYRGQASELVTRNAPAFARLTKRLDTLRQRAADLGDGMPGTAEARELVARAELAANALRDAIAGLPNKIGSAMKTRKSQQVEKTLVVAKAELERGMIALRADLDAAAAELALVESNTITINIPLPLPTPAPPAPAPRAP